jgi:quercetin dioxygenase-like cupin family protein
MEVPALAEGVRVRWLITEETEAPNFAMRQFTVEAGGFTPQHTNPWEHEAFILEGSGTVQGGDEVEAFEAGDVIFVPPDELHQFKNARACVIDRLSSLRCDPVWRRLG